MALFFSCVFIFKKKPKRKSPFRPFRLLLLETCLANRTDWVGSDEWRGWQLSPFDSSSFFFFFILPPSTLLSSIPATLFLASFPSNLLAVYDPPTVKRHERIVQPFGLVHFYDHQRPIYFRIERFINIFFNSTSWPGTCRHGQPTEKVRLAVKWSGQPPWQTQKSCPQWAGLMKCPNWNCRVHWTLV